MQPRRDKLLWHFNSNGIYSVKSGYKIAKQKKAEEDGSLSGSCSSGSDRTWKLLWKVKVRPRVKFFVWKILQNALPTAKNLFIRRVGDGICGVCGEADETIYHCLFECHIPKALWKESPMGKPWSRLPGTSMSDFFHLLFTSGDEFTMAHVTNILWQIWKARCAWLFDNKAVSITSSLYQAEAETKDYISAVNKEDDCQKPIPQIATWKPPCASHVKFNVDAALKDGCMAIGGLVRDHNGATLQSFSMKLEATFEVAVGEALAIYHAMCFAISWGFFHVIFEGDSQAVIHKLVTPAEDRSPLGQIIEDCHYVSSCFDSISFSCVRREGNAPAHLLAKEGLSLTGCKCYGSNPPAHVCSAVVADIH